MRAGAHLRDSGTHLSGADNTDALNLLAAHVPLLLVCLAIGWWTTQAIWPTLRPDRGRYGIPRFAAARGQIIRELESKPGRHLVLVRYAPEHSPHEEWVYNRANLDGSRILWARSRWVSFT